MLRGCTFLREHLNPGTPDEHAPEIHSRAATGRASRVRVRRVKRAPAILALSAAVSCTGVTFATPTLGAEPLAGTVAVPDGRYGGFTAAGDMVSFKVRHRKIVNPRVALAVECTHSDGTSIEVMFGPTPEHGVVGGTIPRSGVGSISWVQDTDSSLIANATIRVSYTFSQGHGALASVTVEARDSDASCAGEADFQLNHQVHHATP